MNILFYTPFNSRSRDTESVMEAFVNQGKSVFLLTQTGRGPYHQQCEKVGVKTNVIVFVKRNPLVYFLKHAFHLFRFCKKNEIDIVYAHLETAALPAVLVQYFIKAKVVACRHIIDEAFLLKSRNFILLNKIVYRLARNVVVVSERARDFMIREERINPIKIKIIRLAYNFDLFDRVDHERVVEIRQRYPCELLLLTACRMVAPKRPDFAIRIAFELLKKNVNIKLLLLGEGPEMEKLKETVRSEGMEGNIFLLGFQTNIMDYLAASDMLVHPSVLDSSSVIIKEAGLQRKAVIACKEIGDVAEYLSDKKNAFLISSETAIESAVEVITRVLEEKVDLVRIGNNLEHIVKQRFSIETIIHDYNRLHEFLEIA